ncbi:MAG: NYN domain-containing protein [Candidatus Ratteibacteria bacterium]|nr:NYN domain-containing protein [Candidatus Ratteibacteria bacterium]
MHEKEIKIEEPKCNFDVEMALDVLDATDRISGIFLFSGDSDLHEPLERLKLKGKNIYVFGVRGQVARELWSSCSRFINFGKWYQGAQKRKSRFKEPGPRV